MTRPTRPHPLRWMPAFLVGLAAATAAELTGSLLLYTGPGLVRSLTVVLAVEAGAFALGLLFAPRPGSGAVDALRRRWILLLAAFLIATVYAASWSILGEVGGTALGQGLGLAFLAGLPLYAAGGVLGAMVATAGGSPVEAREPVGGPAALGASVGFLATGFALPQLPVPASLFLVCLVLLSAAGLIYGSVLDGRVRVDVRARRRSPLGEVRVEDRHLPAEGRAVRVLREGASPRRWHVLGGEGAQPWELALFESLHRDGEGRPRVLLVGGGASAMPRLARRAHPEVRVDVLERSREVLDLGRRHGDTELAVGDDGRVRVEVGNLEDLMRERGVQYDLVLVDASAFASIGGFVSLSKAGRAALPRLVAPGGVLAFGPWLDPYEAPVPSGWVSTALRREGDGPGPALGADLPPGDVVVACWNGVAPAGLSEVPGFTEMPGPAAPGPGGPALAEPPPPHGASSSGPAA